MRREYSIPKKGRPEGALPGFFSVSATKKVHFSQGNLYCDRGSGTYVFGFEEKQYYFRTRYITNYRANLADDYYTPENTSGLFQWDVSKASAGNDYGAFGIVKSITGSSTDVMDWGPTMGRDWYTLSHSEWYYLRNTRENASSLQAVSNVHGVDGIVLAPDDYTGVIPSSFTDSEWEQAESDGVVFLPAAGYMDKDGAGNFYTDYAWKTGGPGVYGFAARYWTSTVYSTSYPTYIEWIGADIPDDTKPYTYYNYRYNGMSVRLVCEAKDKPEPKTGSCVICNPRPNATIWDRENLVLFDKETYAQVPNSDVQWSISPSSAGSFNNGILTLSSGTTENVTVSANYGGQTYTVDCTAQQVPSDLEIRNASEYVAFVSAVNNGTEHNLVAKATNGRGFEGCRITLENDIDLSGYVLSDYRCGYRVNAGNTEALLDQCVCFRGMLDGLGHTIDIGVATWDYPTEHGQPQYAALFSVLVDATIYNVRISGYVTLVGTNNSGSGALIAGYCARCVFRDIYVDATLKSTSSYKAYIRVLGTSTTTFKVQIYDCVFAGKIGAMTISGVSSADNGSSSTRFSHLGEYDTSMISDTNTRVSCPNMGKVASSYQMCVCGFRTNSRTRIEGIFKSDDGASSTNSISASWCDKADNAGGGYHSVTAYNSTGKAVNCYFNKTLHTRNDSGQGTGITTQEMTSGNLFNDSDNWVEVAGYYPVPRNRYIVDPVVISRAIHGYTEKGGRELLKGKFSISTDEYVQFSRGNLQATYHESSSAYTWAFAKNQYDSVGNATGNTTIKDDGTNEDGAVVDLFGWTAANKYSDGIKQYGINKSTSASDYRIDANDQCCDWGKTVNGSGDWSILSGNSGEWDFLFYKRTDASEKWGLATLTGPGVKGVVILPDDWFLPDGCSFTVGKTGGYNTNQYDSDTWTKMEQAGAVFLPCNGVRAGKTISYVDFGYYWSRTASGVDKAYRTNFSTGGVASATNAQYRYQGQSVRLVQKFEKPVIEPEFIDLGLPSRLLWANKNVQAKSETDIGAYFSWGNIIGYVPNDTGDGWIQVTGDGKGTPFSSFNFTVYKSLEAYINHKNSDWTEEERGTYDAAYVNIGPDCFMPSKADFEELIANTTQSQITRGGVLGTLFTGKGSFSTNSIFLPYGGIAKNASVDAAGKQASCWSSSNRGYVSNIYYGYGLDCQSTGSSVSSIAKHYGCPIRAVKTAPEIEPEFIDLGLPSKTLWADRNLGAAKETDYGYHLAWGEDTTHYSSINPSEKTFIWKDGYSNGYLNSTYKFCENSTYTKYNNTDNIRVLQLEDDVCYSKYGENCSMPSTSQWQELISYCTKVRKNTGYELTGPNGNKIFLPVNGEIQGTTLYNYDNFGGYYWTKDLNNINEANSFHFGGSNDFYYSGYMRSYGLGVRAVKEAPVPEGFVDLGCPTCYFSESDLNEGSLYYWAATSPGGSEPYWDDDSEEYTKYTGSSDTTLLPEDDAATVNGKGRIPDYSELEWLQNSCTWSFNSTSKIWTVTGPSGKSIQFTHNGVNYDAWWSRTKVPNINNVYVLDIGIAGSGDHRLATKGRSSRYRIRPVMSKG